MPTGQPTTTPSTTAPTTHLFKVYHEDWVTAELQEASVYPLTSVAFLYMVGFLFFFVAEYRVATTLKRAYKINEKAIKFVETGKVAPSEEPGVHNEVDFVVSKSSDRTSRALSVIQEGDETKDPAVIEVLDTDVVPQLKAKKTVGLDGTIFDLDKYLDKAIMTEIWAYPDKEDRQIVESCVFNDHQHFHGISPRLHTQHTSFNKASWNRTTANEPTDTKYCPSCSLHVV